MGVPGFYRTIFQRYLRKIFKRKIYQFVANGQRISHLYMDFNPIIYLALNDISHNSELSFHSIDDLETHLLKNIINTTEYIVNDLVMPR